MSVSDTLLAGLNPRQLEAVTAPEKSILILAGAGSGKTRVLTTRIAYLLREKMTSTSEILAVTFTNKAAKEMLTRLEAMLPYDLRYMWVGTFHGLCNRILRRHAEEANLPKTFQILDSSDQLSLVKRVLKELNLDPEKVDPKYVVNVINWSKEHGLRSGHLTDDDADRETRNIYAVYEQTCQREGVVDFAELLLRCYELLERNEVIRAHYQERFRHILVDEFQDTNILQYRWLQLLSGCGRGPHGLSKNAVFAVGDDDQSIYAFRGANVGNMADFLRDYAVAEPIRLVQNYRSTGVILDAANALIAHNSGRLGKELWTSGVRGRRIVVKELEDDRAEAEWVGYQVKAERERSRTWRDFAILYRTNAQSRAIETAFAGFGIPFRVYGGQRFFERAEVKHVLAYLRLLDNPSDDTSFLRVVNFPARGIGPKTIETLTIAARAKGFSLWGAICDETIPKPPKLMAFASLVQAMRDKTAQAGLSLVDTIKLVLNGSGLRAHYETEKDGEDRIANMEETMAAALGYLKNEEIPEDQPAMSVYNDESPTPLQGFLTQATLEAGDKNEGNDVDAVQIMTVHAAKGLEFPYVYIIGAEEGIFPHFSAINGDKNGRGGLDEERRLMYVAITRAKESLVITHAQSRFMHGDHYSNKLSSFVDEIPEELLDVRELEEGSGRSRFRDRDEDGWERPSFGGSRRSNAYGSGRSGGSSSYGSGGYGRSSSYGRSDAGEARAAYGASRKTLSGARVGFKDEPVLKRAAERSAAEAGWHPGELLRHDVFGEGTVLSVTGTGSQARIRIRFSTRGEKELLLAIAGPKLHRLD